MPKGRTLFEILTGTGKEPPAPSGVYNPLGAKDKAIFGIDVLDFRDDLWPLHDFYSWRQSLAGTVHMMADYYLKSDDRVCLIKVVPKDGPCVGLPVSVLLMTQYYPAEPGAMPYDPSLTPEILAALDDPTGEFYKDRGLPTEECYWRLGGKVPIPALVTDNFVGMVRERPYTLWDFHRDTTDEAGQTVRQYLYAHFSGRYDPKTKSTAGGYQDLILWRGVEIEPNRVTLYGAGK